MERFSCSPRMGKDDFAEKSRLCTLQRKVGDSEVDCVVPLLAHICTGKCSGNSHIRAELLKKEVIFPLSNKAQSDWGVEVNFTVCFSLAAVFCSTCYTSAMNEMSCFFKNTFFLCLEYVYMVCFDPSLFPSTCLSNVMCSFFLSFFFKNLYLTYIPNLGFHPFSPSKFSHPHPHPHTVHYFCLEKTSPLMDTDKHTMSSCCKD